MPNKQKHRGQHSNDVRLFNEKWVIVLQQAVKDMSYLLSRDYPDSAALKLVGDKFKLNKRQRIALMRSVCSNKSLLIRTGKELEVAFMKAQEVDIDTYNLLITLESALAGGIVLYCRDGCYRDIASVHGTYRKVEETIPAIRLIGECLEELGVKQANWYIDSPISNSGRLKMLILGEGANFPCNWNPELAYNPDKKLVGNQGIVISSDSWILDNAIAWFNLAGYIIEKKIAKVNIKHLY